MDKDYIITALSNSDRIGRGSFRHFIKLSDSKHAVKDLINNVENMTEAEIDATTQRKWIKVHLKKLRNEIVQRPEGSLSPEEIASIMIQKSQQDS